MVNSVVNPESIVYFVVLLIGGVLLLNSSQKSRISKTNSLSINSLEEGIKESSIAEVEHSPLLLEDSPDTGNVDSLLKNSHNAEDANLSKKDSDSSDVNADLPELIISPQTLLKSEDVTRTVGNYKFIIRSFRTPKDGLTEEECEDNSTVSSENSETLRVAVCDGATEGIFSSIWSEILVRKYVENGSQVFEPSKLELAYNEFVQKASLNISKMPETRHWFMYEKLERGTHATIAGVEFFDSNTMHISTVGDSCVFWDDGNEVGMLPELSPEDFGSFPNTICHTPSTWKNLEQKIIKKEVSFRSPIQIALCTDALACWLVKRLREQNEPSTLDKFFQVSDLSSFEEFIQELRERKEIRNDDVTLVLINVLSIHV
jgi:hypothetical protein